MAPLKAKLDGRDKAANDDAAPRSDPVFDLAFVLVIALWGIGVALALTRGAEWRLFALCVAMTMAVALFGLFDWRKRSDKSPGEGVVRASPAQEQKGPR